MCGIAGILSIEPNPLDQNDWLIQQMTDSLAHRGPNDRGTWSNSHITLGSRRLSVIDLSSAGHMPMSNEDGKIFITYKCFFDHDFH